MFIINLWASAHTALYTARHCQGYTFAGYDMSLVYHGRANTACPWTHETLPPSLPPSLVDLFVCQFVEAPFAMMKSVYNWLEMGELPQEVSAKRCCIFNVIMPESDTAPNNRKAEYW